ncbi:MAG: DUF4340 domain-containing protein [Treponema sp.]|nr:DUF4340 domain-containing protein [Treponema sp.]
MAAVSIRKPETAFTLAGIAAALLVTCVIARGNVWLASYRNNSGLWDVSAADIVRITIINGGEELVFENSPINGWELILPEGIPCDRAIAEALPLTLAALKEEKEIDAAPFSGFGLDQPVIIRALARTSSAGAHVHTTEAAPPRFSETEYELLLGGKNSDNSSRYFSVNGKIYTMDAAVAGTLALDSLAVRDKNVLKLNRSLRLADIAAKIENIRVNGEQRPEFSAAEYSAALARLNADRFIGEIPFEAELVVEFDYSGEARTLYLGAPSPDGDYYYAKTTDSDVVFTVSRRGLDRFFE